MDEEAVESTDHGGRSHDPRHGRDGERHQRGHLPGKDGGERCGEDPDGDPDPAPRRRSVRRLIELADAPEEEQQVEIGEGDEGDRAAIPFRAVDAEREVDGEGDEADQGRPRDAAHAAVAAIARRSRGIQEGIAVVRHCCPAVEVGLTRFTLPKGQDSETSETHRMPIFSNKSVYLRDIF